jgi:hypothetical protein
MSPTSYRTAPPRNLIVTTTEDRVKPAAAPETQAQALGFTIRGIESGNFSS